MRRLHARFISFSTWLVSFSMLVMTGCYKPVQTVASTPASLPYKVDGALDTAVIKMQENFNKNGIQVITLGQDYLISIPSSHLFANQSPRLTWRSYALLNDIACYLRQFRKITIHITAYSSKCGSPQRERALTLARARAVANYLWTQNIDSRFIFTHGLGSDKPILGLVQGGDKSPNSRIEITFRDAVA
ncbi:type IVB secretion system protein IcmN/DotK [Legionella oakridgensis]|uniref:type IVB secretion system protein IcmN/DotK n=1 Tax=Legionella oakridgensis TaxID=29423 RepID=UPI0003DE36B9|nr:type IVB secretion system protein IcmN/DotK [Legionella oakridgensis]ETO92538.1 outer membrane protein [Legionella oakridgensis RV-2-2007]